MIRRLIILLLIVGCDKDTPTESSVHPLVGVWEGTELKITTDEGSATISLGENTDFGTLTYIFGADGKFSFKQAVIFGQATGGGTWSSTANKITSFF